MVLHASYHIYLNIRQFCIQYNPRSKFSIFRKISKQNTFNFVSNYTVIPPCFILRHVRISSCAKSKCPYFHQFGELKEWHCVFSSPLPHLLVFYLSSLGFPPPEMHKHFLNTHIEWAMV